MAELTRKNKELIIAGIILILSILVLFWSIIQLQKGEKFIKLFSLSRINSDYCVQIKETPFARFSTTVLSDDIDSIVLKGNFAFIKGELFKVTGFLSFNPIGQLYQSELNILNEEDTNISISHNGIMPSVIKFDFAKNDKNILNEKFSTSGPLLYLKKIKKSEDSYSFDVYLPERHTLGVSLNNLPVLKSLESEINLNKEAGEKYISLHKIKNENECKIENLSISDKRIKLILDNLLKQINY